MYTRKYDILYMVIKIERILMIYGIILAGGIGKRMETEKPKQFLCIGEKPIIVHTVEKFVLHNNIDFVIVLTPKDWINHTNNLLSKYLSNDNEKHYTVIEGGTTRNETIFNAINYIDEHFTLDDESIIVTHDAVRPFITHRIIKENIDCVKKFRATDTVISATDTIIESIDNNIINTIPERKYMYQGQTPQSFYAREFRDTYNSLTTDEKSILTDAAKIYVLKNKPVHLIKGETFNIKITYPYDLELAETLLKGGYKE